MYTLQLAVGIADALNGIQVSGFLPDFEKTASRLKNEYPEATDSVEDILDTLYIEALRDVWR